MSIQMTRNVVAVATALTLTWLVMDAPGLPHGDPATRLLGRQVLSRGDSAHTVDGVVGPIQKGDSSIAIIFTDARCPACRTEVRTFPDLVSTAEHKGIAVRIVTANPPAVARQFGRLIGNSTIVRRVSDMELFRRLGITSVPTVVLIDKEGRVRGYWHGMATAQERVNAL